MTILHYIRIVTHSERFQRSREKNNCRDQINKMTRKHAIIVGFVSYM